MSDSQEHNHPSCLRGAGDGGRRWAEESWGPLFQPGRLETVFCPQSWHGCPLSAWSFFFSWAAVSVLFFSCSVDFPFLGRFWRIWASLMAETVKNLLAMLETWV